MARKKKEKWMQETFSKNKGALHRDLHVPLDETIPMEKIRAAAKKKGIVGQRARAALNAINANKKRKRKK